MKSISCCTEPKADSNICMRSQPVATLCLYCTLGCRPAALLTLYPTAPALMSPRRSCKPQLRVVPECWPGMVGLAVTQTMTLRTLNSAPFVREWDEAACFVKITGSILDTGPSGQINTPLQWLSWCEEQNTWNTGSLISNPAAFLHCNHWYAQIPGKCDIYRLRKHTTT